MKLNNTVLTLALVGVLALAALAGGLLPMGNVVHAVAPSFVDGSSSTKTVPENTPPGVNIGTPASATDPDEATEEFGNTLTYSLRANAGTADARAEAAAFDIDASTGQLITKAPLDEETKSSYTVVVRVTDSETPANTADQTVTITVGDENEPPEAPFPPTVVSWDDPDTTADDESTTSLRVVWHPPVNMGDNISDYNVAYKKSTETTYYTSDNPDTDSTEVVTEPGTGTTATITGLEADTSYDVRVEATNGEGTGPWSLVGTGSTNKEGNSPPVLNDDTPATPGVDEREVAENTPAGENVGSPVTATDGDTTTLTYGLGGPHADLFNFNTRSGQIRTKTPLNHEDPRCYDNPATTNIAECFYVTVTVVDGAGGSDAIGVAIEVNDRTEAPSAPARPTVRATEKSSTSLDVSWSAPANTGPAITTYSVQYRKGSDPFSDDNCGEVTDDNCGAITDTTVKILSLENDTSYEVRVQATNGERASAWSGTGMGRTNKANHEPIFDDRPGTGAGSTHNSDYTISRTIDENPRSGQSVGRIFADDADNDRLTYKLVAFDSTDTASVAEAGKFTISETTGEVRTKAGETYNYEALAETGTCGTLSEQEAGSDRCYTVKVEVRDGLTTDRVEVEEDTPDDSITLRIGIRDRAEAPEVPTVTVTSPARDTNQDPVPTTLIVTWHAENTGPDITSYDLQYRKGGGTFSDDNCGETGDSNCTGLDNDTDDTNLTTITTTTIVDLEEDTSYSVQVRAKNAEGTSAWSAAVTLKTNKGANAPPVFTDTTQQERTREVAEDLGSTRSTRDVGTSVSATDDSSTTLTYSLGGPDAALFTIVSSSGQIRTRSALNHEDPACGYDSADVTTECSYTVRVKVDDRAGGSASIEVTINVTDEPEPPSAPSAPRVTATKDTGQSLDVSWNAPQNAGKPPINDYDIQYREVKTGASQDAWQLWPHGTDITGITDTSTNTKTSTKITRRLPAEDADRLKPSTQYEVRVRAKNGEDDTNTNWSPVAKATTGKSNSRPSFDISDTRIVLRVDENTRANQNIGNAVSASDADSNSLTYSLEGPGKDSFTIVSSSGQIRTRSALDHETRDSYSVTVKVDDRQSKSNSVAAKSVTITVDDVLEPPPAPAAPTVAGIPGSTSSIRVTWAEPANTGPRIDGYDVNYREVGDGPTRWPHTGADRSTIITGLKAGTRYEVQVRARSDEGTGEWSRWGAGMPNPDVANRNPTFTGASRSLSVPENTSPNTDIGDPIAATDRDGDTLTYTLEGADADSFDILSTSDGGQIRTSAELNHEEKSRYTVTVRVRDGRGGTDAVNITISVTDVDNEAPDTPFAPTVTAVSSSSLQVTWDAPANAGPPITDYDYRYREPGGSWTEETTSTITATTVTIDGLAASTSYDVEVRAKNAEGTSDWSNPGIGATNAPGANNPPVFDEGATATREVSASAQAGAFIGEPIRATDADSDDTVTYGLEGRDAGLFDINDTSGQLLTRSGVSLILGETYTVIVTADDQTDVARINVSIEITAAPPNNPPVFSGGARSFSILEGTQAGRNVGSPVTATDADTGDTVTYSLEGTDAASFDIVATSGQIQTLAALDASTKSTYSVTVKATDSRGGADTIAVTITVTARPTSYGCATRGAVTDTSNTGLVADCEALRASRDSLEDGGARLNWHEGTPINRWDGIKLGGTPTRVVEVDLTSYRLAGTLPAELGSVSMLTALKMRNNQLTGSIPPELNRLTRLETLLLHDNELSGAIPDLSNLRNLKMLWLSGRDMNLTGGLPAWMGNMSSLESVSLWGNSLGGFIPNLTGMTSVHLLKLQSNGFRGNVPSWFADMRSLRTLYLHDNALAGSIPSAFGRHTLLRRLWLDRNQLTGSIPAELGNMTNLRTLNLRDNRLTGPIPPELGRLSNLQHLRLHDNRLTGSIPTELSSLSNLIQLWVANNELSGSIPSELGGMISLQDLNLRMNSLSGNIPSELSPLSDTLTRLRIGGEQVKDDNDVVISELRGNEGLTGCVPASLRSATDDDDLRLAGANGISICP